MRIPRVAILLAAIAVAAAVIAGLFARRSAPRPDVIVYLVDTLRADHLGAYGYPGNTTPAMDRFVRESVHFRRAYSPSSWTRPSVASVMTGLIPSRHGAVRRESCLAPDPVTLAEVLHGAGYTTAAFVSNPNILPVFGFERGFDRFVPVDIHEVVNRADRVNDAVFSFLDEEREDGPLFLYIHTMDPHWTYSPPAPYEAIFAPTDGASATPIRTERGRYDGEIAFNDRQFRRLLAGLRARNGDRDAIVVLISDHGEEFLDHGGRVHGKTLFQEQLRVPLAIRLPGRHQAGRVVDAPVRTFDLLPTVCDLLRLPVPGAIDGESLAPQMRGLAEDDGDEVMLYAELDLDRFSIKSIISDGYKLIDTVLPEKRRGRSLFHLETDPGERRDLYAERPDVASGMERVLDGIRSGLTSGLFVEFVNDEVRGPKRRATGAVRVEGGSVSTLVRSDLEEADRIALGPDSTEITFDLELENRETGKVLIDTDRIRFSLEPADARFEVTASVDGVPLPAGRFLIGAADVPPDTWPGPFRADDPSLERDAALVMRPGSHPDAVPFCRVYAVRPAADIVADIDASTDEQLRALGYVD
jgi:choline-sulfatase